jgi:5-methylcytosine-specific restriction endonuclease McrA
VVPYLLNRGPMPNKKKYQSIKRNLTRLDHTRDYNAKWIKTNRAKYPFTHFCRDVRKRRKIKITSFQFWCIAKKQKLICPLTGRKLTGDTISLDHIIPRSKGGTDEIHNLQFVHVDANYAKRNLLQAEFILMCNDVSNHNHS